MRPIRWDGFGRAASVGDAHGGTARGWEGLEEGTGGLSHEPEGTPALVAAYPDFLV